VVRVRVKEEEKLRTQAREEVFKIVSHYDMRSKEKILQTLWEFVGDLIRHTIPWDDYVYRRLVNIYHENHYRKIASLYNLIRLQMDDWQKVAKLHEGIPGALARLIDNGWNHASMHPKSVHYCIWVLKQDDTVLAEVSIILSH